MNSVWHLLTVFYLRVFFYYIIGFALKVRLESPPALVITELLFSINGDLCNEYYNSGFVWAKWRE